VRPALAPLLLAGAVATACLPPEWGANAILHPTRRPLVADIDLPHRDVSFLSDGLRLRGWLFATHRPRTGLIVYLHGVADNRGSGLGLARRFASEGYDVLAYDSRAHGESEGQDCTYGFYEKRDLARALDAVNADGAILFGVSLGAAVALQATPEEPRVRGVIALSAFSDLDVVIRERAPWIASGTDVDKALALAERRGNFQLAEVSPRKVAARIHVPVLLIHGREDRETPAAHSQRIYDALAGPRRLLLVPGAGHNDVLSGADVWREIDTWLAGLTASH